MSNQVTVTITVNPAPVGNTAPRLVGSTSINITSPAALNVAYSGADSDVPANTLTFTKVSGPAWLSFTRTGTTTNATLTGTPPTGTSVSNYTTVLSVADNGSPALSSQVTVTITVNPAPPVGALQFAQASYSVGEGSGAVTLSVTRTGGSSGAVGVSYASANGSATAGQDYTATNGVLSWVAGDAAAKAIVVPIIDDSLIETNETFTVTLTSPTGGATLGSPATATVTIVDNDVPTCVATRQLPSGYLPGVRFTVTLATAPPVGMNAYAVADNPPTGWTVGLISDAGSFDAVTGKVKFGPFFDSVARTLTYEITPAMNATGTNVFTGVVAVNVASTPICGATNIARLLNHPADNGPTDFIMTINEMTAYSTAWLRGDTWPQGPNPIDISYVTRAGFLWRNGESYTVDGTQAPPLSWIPSGVRPLHATRIGQAVATPPVQGAWRLLPPKAASNSPTTVTIIVTPSPTTSAYAVEDAIPAGWTLGAISGGGSFDAVNRRVKWGPFFDPTSRTLSYDITPTNAGAGFAGSASFDGVTLTTAGEVTTLVTGPLPNAQLSPPTRVIGGEFALPFSTRPGHTYVVEVSNDLRVWTPVWTNSATTGSLLFREVPPGTATGRFYRTIER